MNDINDDEKEICRFFSQDKGTDIIGFDLESKECQSICNTARDKLKPVASFLIWKSCRRIIIFPEAAHINTEEEKNNHIEEFVLLVFSDNEIEEERKPAEEYTD